jgi:hypothetical protein
MKSLHESIFTSEIIFQAKLVLLAVEQLENSIEGSNKIKIWSSIQSILISSGNISKILWPKKKYYERGKQLRALLNIDENCILQNRTFRNKFEHYDDLIDEFFEEKNTSSYVDLAMNPSMTFFGPRTCHRGYNTSNNTLVIRGETLELNDVINAVKEIKTKCESLFIKP